MYELKNFRCVTSVNVPAYDDVSRMIQVVAYSSICVKFHGPSHDSIDQHSCSSTIVKMRCMAFVLSPFQHVYPACANMFSAHPALSLVSLCDGVQYRWFVLVLTGRGAQPWSSMKALTQPKRHSVE